MTALEEQQVTVLVEQFKSLRAEIAQRSGAQATLIQINVAAIGIVLGGFFSNAVDNRVLFIIPVVSPILGILFLDHDLAIRRIGNFIQKEIMPAIFERVGAELPEFEKFVRGLELKRLERVFLLGLPVLIIFAVLPIGALCAPFFLHTLKDLKEEIFLFAIPGALFVAIFLPFWFGLAWVRPERMPRHKHNG